MPLAPGSVFTGYRIERQLGAGGMGEVYLAQHPRLPRSDALKILPASLPGSSAGSDDDYRRRFVREADLSAKLWHPNIVTVHDRGEFEGRLWISMDFVPGTDAAELLAVYPKGVRPDLALQMVTEVAAALDYAHGQGLLHRDVKPGNIMLTEAVPHRVMLTDFGIARSIEGVEDITQTGLAVGTLAYAAPEQLRGQPVDARADVYALGATAGALLTGAPPGVGRDLPPAAAQVINRALAVDPAQRQQTCAQFASELAVALDLPPVPPAAMPQGPDPTKGDHASHAPTLLGLPTARPSTNPPPTSEQNTPTQFAATPPPQPPPPTFAPAPQARRSHTPLIVGLLAVITVIALGVVAAVTFWPDDDEPDQTTAQSMSTRVGPAPGSVGPGLVEQAPLTQTTLPVSTAPTTTTTLPAPVRNAADLGLSVPISTPACDGAGIVVVANATNPSSYRDEMAAALANNPGAQYLRTDISCPSLRQRDDNGNLIYAAYVVVGQGKTAICDAFGRFADDDYGKVLDSISDPAVFITRADC
ncbi:serine/threonine-protein kinase [Gordonia rubripertincta]|uniref:non-specific serine/threonine protein kinase n=1 Tax=Gordonia rubripertincta TaxID=36822 RepID=A0ABT4N0C0_GORRU|nr:serine/threonine-protein kinase [Gordonia rubripertincta]MCZ4552703.1 serine/threonine-protein kinase [Gordonia rubripertincta]